MKKANFFAKKIPVVALIAVLLVAVLGSTIFGLEYYSLRGENKEITSRAEVAEKLGSELQAQNREKDKQIGDLNSKTKELEKTVSDLNNTVNRLNSEVSKIKAMKAAQSKAALNSKKSSSVVSSKPADILSSISLANFTAPNEGNKVCYLTFDDGPSDNTLKILEILKTANAKASFFVVGTSKTEYIKNIYEAGHTVALHTNTHAWSIYKNEQTYYNDLNAVKAKVKSIIGIDVNIMRFPGGSSNKKSKEFNKGIMTRLIKSVGEQGFKYVDWNIDSGDASGTNVPAKTLVSNVINDSDCKNGNTLCILMHDTGSKKTTVEALPYIICGLRAKGYRFEALTNESNAFHHAKLNN